MSHQFLHSEYPACFTLDQNLPADLRNDRTQRKPSTQVAPIVFVAWSAPMVKEEVVMQIIQARQPRTESVLSVFGAIDRC
jgi:hypothetical protein